MRGIMKRRQKGSSLSQYGIVLGLVALAIIPVFLVFGNEIVAALTNYVNQYQNINNKMSNNANKTPSLSMSAEASGTMGEFSGSTSSDCTDGICTIDFGNLKLTGVPQNLNNLIETSGSAAGTDSLLKLLQQIADSKEATDPAEAQKIESLVARGKEIMQQEQTFDDWFNKYESSLAQYKEDNEKFQDAKKALQDKYNATCSSSSSSSYSSASSTTCTFKSSAAETAYYKELSKLEKTMVINPNKALLDTFSAMSPVSINGNDYSTKALPWYLMYSLNPTAIMHVDDSGTIDFKANKIDFNTTTASQFDDMVSGKTDFEYYKDPGSLPTGYSSGTFITSPVGYYLTELKNVLQTTKDPNVMSVTKQLSDEIYSIASKVSEKSAKIDNYIWSSKPVDYNIPTNNAVVTTNLDLSVICAANGKNYDNASKTCN